MADNLIIGAGAIGTVLAGYLVAARQSVRIAILESECDQFSRVDCLRVDRITGRPPLLVPKPQLTTSPRPRPGENVFICVKHRDFPALLSQLPERMPEGVTLIPCLNGVGASRDLALRYPDSRVVALTIMFNAQALACLHARVTAKPEILLNTEDKALLGLFGRSGVTVRKAGGSAVAWGKLLINLANGICALTHTTFKDLLTQRELTACFVAVLDEAVDILDAAAIRYKLPVALPYPLYRLALVHGGPLPWWIGRLRNNMGEGSYPSMVADVRYGHATEVRQLNGEIVRQAREIGRTASLNQKIVDLIEALEGKPQNHFMTARELRSLLCSRPAQD